MKQLGLTGSIGSGKSTVADRFAALGAEVIDADRLAREATGDPAVLERIAAALGDELVVDGRLDRAKTAALIFADEDARRKLNAIVHPEVRRLSRNRVQVLRDLAEPPPLVVHDVPLLFESGLADVYDATAVVVAPLELRLERVMQRSGLSRADAMERDASQMPPDLKARLATYVIDNGGPLDALDDQVERVWRDLVGADPRRAHRRASR